MLVHSESSLRTNRNTCYFCSDFNTLVKPKQIFLDASYSLGVFQKSLIKSMLKTTKQNKWWMDVLQSCVYGFTERLVGKDLIYLERREAGTELV